ncbi:MAG TPA: cytochrome c [Vicinamibacterales bacterium]|nr:cytochrome c [Vicinamibacterales bacterium]
MTRFGQLLVVFATGALVAMTIRAQERTVWDGIYTDEQATRGEALYGEHCVRCHGATLQGNGEGAKSLTDATFKSTWNGISMGALFDRVRLSMPQDKPGSLTRQQVADLLAFILRANRFPAGKDELVRQTDLLNAIVFKSEK